MRTLIIFDTETGGLDPNQHPILSIGMVLYHGGSIEDELRIVIREDDIDLERATPEALKVNGFTLDRVRAEGISPYDAVTLINQFLLKHDLFKRRVTLGGHNVAFDIGFLKRLYRVAGEQELYAKNFSHRSICTQTLAIALELAGRIHWRGTGLDVLTKHFSIKVREGGAGGKHDALEDARATALLLNELLKFLKDVQRVEPGQPIVSAEMRDSTVSLERLAEGSNDACA